MNKIKFSHIVFSLALIAALAFATIPMAPVHALSNSSASTAVSEKQAEPLDHGVVCKNVIIWHNGHRVVVRICQKVTKPTA